VVCADDETLLVLPSGLPRVSVPDDFWFHDVDAPVRALREQLGIEAFVLSCLDNRPGETSYLMVSSGPIPADAQWVPSFDHPLVELARAHLGRPADSPVTPAWTRPGWYAEALPWIDEQLATAGTPRTGVPDQVRSWGLSNVLRCPTAKGDVYFKALAHSSTIRPARPEASPLLFAHEPLLLQRLSEARPGEVPALIAIDEQRAWMLLPDLGRMLAQEPDLSVWTDALRRHARLQRGFADHQEQLFSFSCVDRRLAVLEGELDRLLGPNPATDRLEPRERRKLPRRAKQLREAITELAAIGVPETLLHGDLHPRNLAVRDGQVLAFDWTDAAVAHPFLDLVTFVEQRSPLSTDPRVTDAYLAEWEAYATPAELRRALALAQELGALNQLMTSLNLCDHVAEPSADAMIRGAVNWLRGIIG
jgi:hypothetical protein